MPEFRDFNTFPGFSEETAQYFLGVMLNNTRAHYEAVRPLYRRAVREPLQQLCAAMTPLMLAIDPNICTKPARCISGAYNDLRYHPAQPLKTYAYLHFCAQPAREEDIPGFFLEFGAHDFRMGLRVYHSTAAGMRRLREQILAHPDDFLRALEPAQSSGRLTLAGEEFKRPPHPGAPERLRPFLARKTIALLYAPGDRGAFLTPGLASELAACFSLLAPLYHFECAALSQPERRPNRAV